MVSHILAPTTLNQTYAQIDRLSGFFGVETAHLKPAFEPFHSIVSVFDTKFPQGMMDDIALHAVRAVATYDGESEYRQRSDRLVGMLVTSTATIRDFSRDPKWARQIPESVASVAD